MNELSKQEQSTISVYDKIAERWCKENSRVVLWRDEINQFHDLLPKGKILEVGCGGGRDAKELISLGYDYVGTDLSEGLLTEARKVNPNSVFENASLYDLDYKKPFDGFWCSAVLLHIPRDRAQEALQSIHRNMRHRAIGFIAIKEGLGEEVRYEDDDQSNGRLFVYWHDEDFTKLLEQNGYSIALKGYKPVSDRTKWLAYHVSVE